MCISVDNANLVGDVLHVFIEDMKQRKKRKLRQPGCWSYPHLGRPRHIMVSFSHSYCFVWKGSPGEGREEAILRNLHIYDFLRHLQTIIRRVPVAPYFPRPDLLSYSAQAYDYVKLTCGHGVSSLSRLYLFVLFLLEGAFVVYWSVSLRRK